MGAGWKTPPFVPAILREYGFEPDFYLCNRTQRLQGVTVDADPKQRPVVIADMNALPFHDRAFRCGFYDPPYDVPYKRAVNELLRVCRERAVVLHVRDVGPGYLNPGPKVQPWTWRRTASILLLCGNDAVVRCLNLFHREKE